MPCFARQVEEEIGGGAATCAMARMRDASLLYAGAYEGATLDLAAVLLLDGRAASGALGSVGPADLGHALGN